MLNKYAFNWIYTSQNKKHNNYDYIYFPQKD